MDVQCFVGGPAACLSARSPRNVVVSSKPTPTEKESCSALREEVLNACSIKTVRGDGQQQPASPETYAALLQRCGKMGALAEGRQVHEHICRYGLDADKYLGNHLVDMYGRCDDVEVAAAVFRGIWNRSVVSWNVMIRAYARNGYSREAIVLFWRMDLEGMKPNEITLVSVVDACGSLSAISEAKMIHARAIASGFESNVIVGNSIVNMYGKCRKVDDARDMFDRICDKDLVSWNSMVAAYAQNGNGKEALQLFQKMEQEGMKPDEVALAIVVHACSRLGSLEQGVVNL